MRFFVTAFLAVFIIGYVVIEKDFIGEIKFNPLGHEMDPITYSPNDDFVRESSLINNEQEAEWGKVNFGSLAALQNLTQDPNGVDQIGISDTTPMKDMEANWKVDSQISPFPNGVTIGILPGVQKNEKALSAMVFSPTGTNNFLAPRDYYLTTKAIKGTFNLRGQYFEGVKSTVHVLQVPMLDDAFVKDTSGIVLKAGEVGAVAKDIQSALTKLNNLASNSKSTGKDYQSLLLNKSLTGVSNEFSNVNRMINTGTYSTHYKAGLTMAVGDTYLPGVAIKTSGGINNVYEQFDHLYKHLKSDELTRNYYAKPLRDWAKNNATQILATLVVNYQIQSKSRGKAGSYNTPISMSKSKESTLSFSKDLSTARNLKEPFYMYATIVGGKSIKSKKLEEVKLKDNEIIPDLAYIFGLYHAIHLEVWAGSDGYLENRWKTSVTAMNNAIKKNKLSGKNLPKDANAISTSWSEYSNNNLVKGLSKTKSLKSGKAAVYPNQRIVGALRAILPKGNGGSNSTKLKLYSQDIKITKLDNTTYLKDGKSSYLYTVFANAAGTTHSKWRATVGATDKTPVAPAVFTSYWGGGSYYVMMPNLLGGTAFPTALSQLTNSIMTKGGGSAEGTSSSDGIAQQTDEGFKTLSFANFYVIATNLSPSEIASKNTDGVRVVAAGTNIGGPRDASMGITLAGYAGGESFNIADYAKAVSNLTAGKEKNGIKIKDVQGKTVELEHFPLFERFFTIRSEGDFVGTGKGKVTYTKSFDQKAVIDRWEKNKMKAYVEAVSPNYTKFFGEPATIGEGAKAKDTTEAKKETTPSKNTNTNSSGATNKAPSKNNTSKPGTAGAGTAVPTQ